MVALAQLIQRLMPMSIAHVLSELVMRPVQAHEDVNLSFGLNRLQSSFLMMKVMSLPLKTTHHLYRTEILTHMTRLMALEER
jgi:hypothetical protein